MALCSRDRACTLDHMIYMTCDMHARTPFQHSELLSHSFFESPCLVIKFPGMAEILLTRQNGKGGQVSAIL